jgi:hypothetical protein
VSSTNDRKQDKTLVTQAESKHRNKKTAGKRYAMLSLFCSNLKAVNGLLSFLSLSLSARN